MKNLFAGKGKNNIVIVAGNIDDIIYNSLKELKLRVIKTIAHKGVDRAIKYHPDIVMHPIGEDLLVVEPTVFDYYKEALKDTSIELIKGEKKLGLEYPDDIAYNVGRIGNYALHDFRYTDEKIKYYLKKENIKQINVKQGYTKCSMAVVGDSEVITSDVVIDRKLKEKGFESLLISPGYIYLEDHPYGFIGGCTGNISNRDVLLSGSLEAHPDKGKIEKFLLDRNKNIIYLSDKKIRDIGTIIGL